MNRRQYVASLGVLVGGGAAAVGTGAFSSVEAERDVAITVAEDAGAYLGIQPVDGPNGNYVDTTGSDALALNLTGDNDNIGNGLAGGEGLNTNAVTSMADVFEVRNQGTQEVELAVTPLAYGDLDGTVFPPDIDGALAVLLIPDDPDDIEVEIEWGIVWPGIPVPEDVSFIGIKDLSPGERLRFHVLGMALPESAIGSTAISDELVIAVEAT